MRTTLDLDDALLHEAQVCAAREQTSLKSLVEEALRARLEKAPRPRRTPGDWPTWDGGGFPEGLDLTSNSALERFLDEYDRANGPLAPRP